MSDAFFSSPKSLTPQRKHHKLLKDGSEVWSEGVEKIFVQGLKDYWESPWATYSRGRSRWRNQFLVDHLKKHGIDRSKKQVASHIQVLRNMWRGQPEFHLVAGGEELFLEDGLLASPKKTATPSTPGSELLDDQLAASPPSTPPSVVSEFTPHTFPSSSLLPHFTAAEELLGTRGSPSRPDAYQSVSASPSSLALPYTFSPPSPPAPRNRLRPAVKLEPLHMNPGLFNLPSSPQGSARDTDHPSLVSSYGHAPSSVKVLSLVLWADGIQPFTADTSRLNVTFPPASHPPDATSVLIRVKIGISPMNDIHSSPNLHGFHAAITFSEGWKSEAKCITKSCAAQECISQEVGFLEVNPPSPLIGFPFHAVTCVLPDSSLSRCKWLPLDQDNITQQIIVDDVVVAAFVYHIERTAPGSLPFVELVDFRKYKPNSRQRTQSQRILFSPPLSAHSSTSSVSSSNYQRTGFGGHPIPLDFTPISPPDPHLINASQSFTFNTDPTGMYGLELSSQMAGVPPASSIFPPTPR